MGSLWTGSVFFSERVLAYLGPIGPTHPHAHHAVQVALGFTAPLVLEDDRSRRAAGKSFVVPPDASHAIRTPCEHALFVFVDAEDVVGRAIASRVRLPGVIEWRRAGHVSAATEAPAPHELRRAVAELLAVFARERSPRPTLHPAVLQAIKVLPELLDTGDARLGTLAKRVALSESHLAHLFRAQVGIPLRPYVLWLRLRKAATEIKRGQSLTVAAQAAGFADSSHLSNTFRRTFGLTPSELVRHVEWIE